MKKLVFTSVTLLLVVAIVPVMAGEKSKNSSELTTF